MLISVCLMCEWMDFRQSHTRGLYVFAAFILMLYSDNINRMGITQRLLFLLGSVYHSKMVTLAVSHRVTLFN